MESFDHITLTEEETAEALRKGREEKDLRLRKEAYSNRLKAMKEYPSYSYYNLLDQFSADNDVDDNNRTELILICQYFAGFQVATIDLNKGLFIQGGVGVGKTTIMNFFKKNQRQSYRMESCRDVEMNYGAYGDEYLFKVSSNLPIPINSDPFGHQSIGYCFDDLGTEADGKNYGKSKNVMAEVLLNRYDNEMRQAQLEGRKPVFTSTHVTTNLTADEIKQQYGTRLTDRIREMFNIIQFPGNAKSRR